MSVVGAAHRERADRSQLRLCEHGRDDHGERVPVGKIGEPAGSAVEGTGSRERGAAL